MKTKALISFAVTAKLICAFVFAYADCWFSHEAAHFIPDIGNMLIDGLLAENIDEWLPKQLLLLSGNMLKYSSSIFKFPVVLTWTELG